MGIIAPWGINLPRSHGRILWKHSRSQKCSSLPFDSSNIASWSEQAFKDLVLESTNRPKKKFSLEKACLILSIEEEEAYRKELQNDIALLNVQNQTFTSLDDLGSHSTWDLSRIDALAMECAARFMSAVEEVAMHSDVTSSNDALETSSTSKVPLTMVEKYPILLISCINDVLFHHHGYERMRSHGNPRDSSFASVLEYGRGSPGSLAVLYMAVSERVGMKLAAKPLDNGRFFCLWPENGDIALRIGSERVVIDPYGQGSLVTETELRMLFSDEFELQPDLGSFACSSSQDSFIFSSDSSAKEVNEKRNEMTNFFLQPASVPEILAAVLEPIKDAYWCMAIDCPPEPAFMIPLDIELALRRYNDLTIELMYEDENIEHRTVEGEISQPNGNSNHPWPSKGFALSRCLAAAKKRQMLQPNDPQTSLDIGILFYFSEMWEEAWLELSMSVEIAEQQDAWNMAKVAKELAQKALVQHQLSTLDV